MEERYHYNDRGIVLCERHVCSLEHYSIDEAFALPAGDVLGDRYSYRPRHRREGVA